MNAVTCPHCGKEVEIDKALEGQIEARVLAAAEHRHEAELEKIRAEAAASAKKSSEAAADLARKAAAEDLEIAKKQMEAELLSKQKREASEHDLLVKSLRDDAETEKEQAKKLREQLGELMKTLREEKEARASAEEQARKAAADDLEIAKKQMEANLESNQKKAVAEQEILIKTLKEDADSEKEQSKKLREQIGDLMQTLREEKEARANAELEAQKKLAAGEDKIREDATKNAAEAHRLKQLEMEKKLSDTQRALEDAQRKATQGSQQNQGEVLELDIESRLREEFPLDEFSEVKKGQRGADIKHAVKNMSMIACGIILWETKNGKWQPAWVPKFKQDIREASANIGVIVSQEMPTEYGDMKHLDTNVWVVKPRLAPILASALRATILQVDSANRNNQGKDAKMEALYQFLVGPEFRHRVEAIVENYGTLQAEIEKEKRASVLRWAHQEKAIRAVIDNTIGMYGDLQGITNSALPSIKTLELSEPELELDEI